MKTWVLLVVAVLAVSCTCRPQIPQTPEAEPEPEIREQAEPQQPQEAAETPEAAEAEPATEPEQAPAQREPVQEAQQAAPEAEEQSFVVTEEVYNRTFEEVEAFIRDLNDIIRSRDYSTWLTYLSEEYIARTGDEAYLREQSEKPLLKKQNIHLESLEDYFEYVVAPSRSQATVEDIEFIDENQVKVISSVRGIRGILYLLVREDGSWRIGVWE